MGKRKRLRLSFTQDDFEAHFGAVPDSLKPHLRFKQSAAVGDSTQKPDVKRKKHVAAEFDAPNKSTSQAEHMKAESEDESSFRTPTTDQEPALSPQTIKNKGKGKSKQDQTFKQRSSSHTSKSPQTESDAIHCEPSTSTSTAGGHRCDPDEAQAELARAERQARKEAKRLRKEDRARRKAAKLAQEEEEQEEEAGRSEDAAPSTAALDIKPDISSTTPKTTAPTKQSSSTRTTPDRSEPSLRERAVSTISTAPSQSIQCSPPRGTKPGSKRREASSASLQSASVQEDKKEQPKPVTVKQEAADGVKVKREPSPELQLLADHRPAAAEVGRLRKGKWTFCVSPSPDWARSPARRSWDPDESEHAPTRRRTARRETSPTAEPDAQTPHSVLPDSVAAYPSSEDRTLNAQNGEPSSSAHPQNGHVHQCPECEPCLEPITGPLPQDLASVVRHPFFDRYMSHQEILSIKYITQRHLNMLVQLTGLSISTGRFTDAEIAAVDLHLEEFRRERNLPPDELENLIRARLDEDKRRAFWTPLAVKLPRRPLQMIMQRVRQTMNEKSTRVPWTEQEDAELRRLVQLRGSDNMSSIRIEGRTPQSCWQRWYDTLQYPERTTGPWSAEETRLLSHTMSQISHNPDAQMTNGRIKWTWVSDHIPGRTPKQCESKWRKIQTAIR